MSQVATLTEAAHLSYKECELRNQATTLIADFRAFIAAAEPIFSDDVPSDRPIGNWLVLMVALSGDMVQLGGNPLIASIQAMNLAAEYLFRMCLAATGTAGLTPVSAAKQAALLAAWNANVGSESPWSTGFSTGFGG